MFYILFKMELGIDVVELCGGAARTSAIAVRRRLAVGGNFDLVTQCDLNHPTQQIQVEHYIITSKPLVIIMAPMCRAFGPMSHLNKRIHAQSWKASYDECAPHGQFCGRMALLQLQHGRHFLREHPHPTSLNEEEPWPEVLGSPGVVRLVFDQCMVDQRASCGRLAKKATELVASSPLLVKPFEGLKCNGRHVHADLTGGKSKPLQLWTWKMASLVVDGICLLKKATTKAMRAGSPRREPSAYPTVGTGPDDDDQPEGEELWRKCPGCRARAKKEDPRHSRVRGVCKWPDIVAENWDCPGCLHYKGRWDSSHNYEPGR